MMLRVSEWVGVWSFHQRALLTTSNSKSKWSSSMIDFNQNRKVVVCGLRSSFKTRRRSRVLSKEGIQVIHALKLAKSPNELHQVVNTKLSRLLIPDVLNLLEELNRQNELHLSLTVFKYIREELELGYARLVQVYADMIEVLGRNKMREMAEELFGEVVPDTRMCSEMIGVYLKLGMTEKAMHIYGSMKEWGCAPDKFTFTILITSLQKTGQQELAEILKQDVNRWVGLVVELGSSQSQIEIVDQS
ncbi:hypothetical protein RJT34_18015 [Clitoria ternatea]|uniref:Pentatricopeptide repeat-containing protein n=1 Tax=Clitoria ternatea TaxID=43366 RepID=A0AAN9JBH6_CLITE